MKARALAYITRPSGLGIRKENEMNFPGFRLVSEILPLGYGGFTRPKILGLVNSPP
jgi:hypothetical protein